MYSSRNNYFYAHLDYLDLDYHTIKDTDMQNKITQLIARNLDNP